MIWRMMRRTTTVLAGVAILAMTGVGFGVASSAQASVLLVPAFSSVPLSSSLSAPEVAAGTAPTGSTIVLFVEPPTSVLAAHKSFTLTPVTRSTVSSGRWQLRLPVTAAVRANEEPSGSANFEAIEFTSTGTDITFFGEQNTSRPALHSLTQWKAIPIARATALPSSPLVTDSWCSNSFVRVLGEQKTLVGETFSSDARATLNFTYGTNATSSLGVAASATAATNSFSESGTETSSAGGSDVFNAVKGAHNEYYDTYFGHALYKQSCFSGKGGSETSYHTVNTGWTTGAAQTSVVNPPYTAEVCAPEPPIGVSVRVDRSSAIDWSNGFTLEGIGLSAETGYATNAEVDTSWPANSNRTYNNRNCGVHNFPDLPGSLIAVARGV
jgi:hypothetical protein